MASGVAKKAEVELRKCALSYPEAVEEFPWGERVIKVRGKIFAFLGRDENGGLYLSAKLPETGALALMLPFAEPTGYNLGKSGWVSASFGPDDEAPMRMLREWIDESYRAVAPKRLVAALGSAQPAIPGGAGVDEGGAGRAKASRKPAKKPAAKKPKKAGSKRAPSSLPAQRSRR